ncbi:hypothetical protein I203_104415 [Kwoniella mangroviensis CBS 8507]|uniref:uncharacterized protein n=1 Tax=Kwoniella mangroviensis CBS 8507 TaxID=1296122 RepID=UPI00080CDFCD|nr:uncharacterized protein I203_00638 [Kwoniella mangroviensis CBS 8507]OCF70503.1 hypothetical protein I203_00638 [Kwoniella mangroviensis CBS 8507]
MDVITLSTGYEATYNASEPGGRNKLSRYVSTLQKELDNSLDNLNTLDTTGYYEGASAAKILYENNDDFHNHFKNVDNATVITLTRQLVEGAFLRLNAQSHKKSKSQGSAGVHLVPGESSTVTARGNQGHFLEPSVQYTSGTYGHQSRQAQPWPQGSLDPRHHTTHQGYYVSQPAATGFPPPPPTGYPPPQPGSDNYSYAQGSLPPILPPNYNQMPPPPSQQSGDYTYPYQHPPQSGDYSGYYYPGSGTGYDPSRHQH